MPSQSKTIRSKRAGSSSARAAAALAGTARILPAAAPRARCASPLAGWLKRSRARAGTCARSGTPRHRLAARERLVQREVAVLVVADDRRGPACGRWTRIWCVRPVLMRHVEQAEAGVGARHAHQRDRAPALPRRRRRRLRTRRSPAASSGTCAAPRRSPCGSPARRRPRARRRSCPSRGARNWSCSAISAERFLAISSSPEVSLSSRCTSSRNARLGPRPAQLLDDAEADAAAAVHRDAGRLVDREQVLVLVHDRELARRRGRRCRRRSATPHRRHAHLVAEREPRVGLGAALVDAHLAGADDAVDMGLRHALQQLAQQEVVEALALAEPSSMTTRRTAGRRGRRRGARSGAPALPRDSPAGALPPIMRCATLFAVSV